MDIVQQIKNAVSKRQTIGSSSAQNDGIHVDYGFDAAYVRPMGVSLTSIVVNNPNIHIHAHLFNSSLGDGDLEKLEELTKQYDNLSIDLYEVKNLLANELPIRRDVPFAMYFRTMMPIILPEVDKLLYMDSDILCLGDISELIKIDMEDKIALVVSDSERTSSKRISAMELKSGKYFNSGVMLIDPRKWNEKDISERFFPLIASSSNKFSFVDQDALNVLLEHNIKYIDGKWNRLAKETIPSDTKLLHCAASPKPWKIFCDSKAQSIFLHYENLSPWKGSPLEYPRKYREAKRYASLLWEKNQWAESLSWYKKYLAMKIQTKYLHPNNKA